MTHEQIELIALSVLIALCAYFLKRFANRNDADHKVYNKHIIDNTRECSQCKSEIVVLKYNQLQSDQLIKHTKEVLEHQQEEFKHIYEVIGRCEGLLASLIKD